VLKLLTRKDAARYLSISERQIDRLRKAGKIRFINLGRSIRFRLIDIERYILEENGDSSPDYDALKPMVDAYKMARSQAHLNELSCWKISQKTKEVMTINSHWFGSVTSSLIDKFGIEEALPFILGVPVEWVHDGPDRLVGSSDWFYETPLNIKFDLA
jgi:excisionase family DNA binding protein